MYLVIGEFRIITSLFALEGVHPGGLMCEGRDAVEGVPPETVWEQSFHWRLVEAVPPGGKENKLIPAVVGNKGFCKTKNFFFVNISLRE